MINAIILASVIAYLSAFMFIIVTLCYIFNKL